MGKEIEINAECICEKEPASLGFGIYCLPEELPDNIDWIVEGISESFWENYDEFMPGIDRAKCLMEGNPEISYEQALFSVFGHFHIRFEVDGREKEIAYDINPDNEMLELLTSV